MSGANETKLGRVRALMDREGYGTLVISRLENVFWLTDGGDAHVGLASEAAVVTLVVTRDAVTAVTTNIEAPRLAAEELGAGDLPLVAVPWHNGSLAAEIDRLSDDDGRVGADLPAAGRELVDLSPLRWALLPEEVTTYLGLGADMGEAVGIVARAVEPGQSELALAGRVSDALLQRGITPVVLLVAADERIARYRHPIPTAKQVETMAMLVACGRRKGLIVALSRLVHFGPLSDDLRRRHEAVCQVDATFIAHTVPGAMASAIFAAGVGAYAEAGYAEEWKLHHQGGATGYAGRDYKATFDIDAVVQPWQAFAWNPSIAGTKSEDTILATPDGPEVISASPDWPLSERTAAGRKVARPDILVR